MRSSLPFGVSGSPGGRRTRREHVFGKRARRRCAKGASSRRVPLRSRRCKRRVGVTGSPSRTSRETLAIEGCARARSESRRARCGSRGLDLVVGAAEAFDRCRRCASGARSPVRYIRAPGFALDTDRATKLLGGQYRGDRDSPAVRPCRRCRARRDAHQGQARSSLSRTYGSGSSRTAYRSDRRRPRDAMQVDQTVVSVGPNMLNTARRCVRAARSGVGGEGSPPHTPEVLGAPPARLRVNIRHVAGVACITVARE